MAQDLVILAGTDTLGDSRGYLNDSDEALQTCFSGASEPPAPIRRPYMFWADTTNGILFQRNGANDAWIAKSVLADAWGGALMKSVASQSMTQPFSMGGNAIEGLGTGSGTSAARKDLVDTKAPLAAPALTGDATVNQDPAGANSLTRKSWTEATFLAKAGGTATGRIGTSSGAAAGATDFLKRDEIRNLTTFDTTSGHNHDGTNSRKVAIADLAALALGGGFPTVTVSKAAEILEGEYTGDNTADRLISLQFRPRILIICGGSTDKILSIAVDILGMGFWGRVSTTTTMTLQAQNRTLVPEIGDNGFHVSQITSLLGLNEPEPYTYYAIR